MKLLLSGCLLAGPLSRGILVGCLSVAVTGPVLGQAGNKEQVVVTLSEPGKPGLLDVDLVGGSITVQGYAGKEVIIDAVPQPKSERQRAGRPGENAAGMKR